MSFFNKLEKLQQSSEKTKKKVLVITVALIMAAVVVVWMNTLDLSMEKNNQKNVYNKNSPPSPFSAIKNTISSWASNMKSVFEQSDYTK